MGWSMVNVFAEIDIENSHKKIKNQEFFNCQNWTYKYCLNINY